MLLPEARYALNQLVRRVEAKAVTRPAAVIKSAYEQSKDLAESAMKRTGWLTPTQARIEVGLGKFYERVTGQTGSAPLIGREWEQKSLRIFLEGYAQGPEGMPIQQVAEGILGRAIKEGAIEIHPTDPTKYLLKDPSQFISSHYKTMLSEEKEAISKYSKLTLDEMRAWRQAQTLGEQELRLEEHYGEQGYQRLLAKEANYKKMFTYEMRELQRIQEQKALKTQSLPQQTAQNPIQTNKKRIQHQVRDQKTKYGHLF